MAKKCNFCDCLCDSLIRDRIVLGIKDRQTTEKLLRIRDLAMNWCTDIYCSQEVTALHMKSLSEPVDNINQGICKKTLEFRLQTDNRERKSRASFWAINTLLRERSVLCGGKAKCVSGVIKIIILPKGAKMPRLTPLSVTKLGRD